MQALGMKAWSEHRGSITRDELMIITNPYDNWIEFLEKRRYL